MKSEDEKRKKMLEHIDKAYLKMIEDEDDPDLDFKIKYAKPCDNCKHAVKKNKRTYCKEPKTIKAIQDSLDKDAEELDVTDAEFEDGCEKFEVI